MIVISLPRKAGHIGHMSDVEKHIGESKAEFNLILSEIPDDRDRKAREAESLIFERLLRFGLFAETFFCKPQ